MNYNKQSHITSVEDVKDFFHFLVFEKHLNFHPDDSFEGQFASLTTAEAAEYDRLMDECFAVCEREDADIYEIGINEMKEAMGINIA